MTRRSDLTHDPKVVGDEHLRRVEDVQRAKMLITEELGLSEDEVYDCRLAITEAVANAFTHGQRKGKGSRFCRVVVHREDGLVRIAVEDRGTGFRWQGLQTRMPTVDQEHGRGVHLIRLLMDGVSIQSTPNGTAVEMVKRVGHRPG